MQDNFSHTYKNKILLTVFFVVFFLWFFNLLFLSTPKDFPVGTIVSVDSGASLRSISLKLKNENIIKSRVAFETLLISYGGERHVVATDYLMDRRLSVFEIARRMSNGETHLAPVKLVVPEGFDNRQIAKSISAKLANFDENEFLNTAKQGYLFPNTYFFLNSATEVDVIKLMSDTFTKKLQPLKVEISVSGRSEQDIITMASIIEREAKGDERNLISGILWKRIKVGMPLQADAAPETYKSKGLPKDPICNPGIESIKAAIHPEDSPYLYYLHDKMGNIHYAKTFTEHKANKFKYLR